MGTAPRMTVAENLLIAKFRGKKRGLYQDVWLAIKMNFRQPLKKWGNGLEKHLNYNLLSSYQVDKDRL